MGWRFDGYCYSNETALSSALNASPERLATYPVIRSFAASGSDNGSVGVTVDVYDFTANTWEASSADSMTFNACSPEGPIETDPYVVTVDQLPAYSGALALMFFTAYAGKKLRTFIEGYSR